MIIIIIVLIRSTQFCGMSSTWLRCWTAASTRSSTAPTISQVDRFPTWRGVGRGNLTISQVATFQSGSTCLFPRKEQAQFKKLVHSGQASFSVQFLELVKNVWFAESGGLFFFAKWSFSSRSLTQHFHFYDEFPTYWIFLRWTSQGTNVSFRQEAWVPERKDCLFKIEWNRSRYYYFMK